VGANSSASGAAARRETRSAPTASFEASRRHRSYPNPFGGNQENRITKLGGRMAFRTVVNSASPVGQRLPMGGNDTNKVCHVLTFRMGDSRTGFPVVGCRGTRAQGA
jgi:hypothetical protein